MSVVSVKDLSFTYPNGHQVLHGLSFELQKGQMLLLCGKNGCGKSTLLRLLKQEVVPKGTLGGSAAVSGESAILFQECDKNIIFRSAYEDLIFPACNSGMPEDEIRLRAAEVLNLFEIEHLKERNTGTLSGGEKQMLALASLMMLKPDVLLLDEPLSQLDEEAKDAFLEKLLYICDAGTAVIIAEHNTDRLLERSDAVLIFDNEAATYYSKQQLCSAPHIPNAPEYVLLEQQLQLPPRLFTAEEAVERLKERKEQLRILPLRDAAITGERVLACEALSFSYNKAPLLTQIDFTLHRGEVRFLCGKNGAGKSTFLYLLCGFLKPAGGKIHLLQPHRIGYLAQNPIFAFLKDTLLEDFRFVLAKNKRSESEIDALFEQYALFEDLKPLLQQNPLDLSGGERAKAAIFKLLLLGRDILLLDEPEKHLDKESMVQLTTLMRHLSANGISFIVVSHSPDFIFRCADTVGEITDGGMHTYTLTQYFPAKCETSLYRAVKASGVKVLDRSLAEWEVADG